VHQQIRTAAQLHHLPVDFVTMLNIRANNQHLTAVFNSIAIRSARVIVPLTGDFGFYIISGREVLAGIFNFQKFKLRPHMVQLHREVLSLQGDLEDFPQIADGLVPAKRENRDFLLWIICLGKKGEALDVIPMKMSEADDQSVLMMSDSAQIPPKIAKPRAGINDGNTICIRERNLKTGGVAAELLEASITDWDGAASTVKFQLHTELYGRLGSRGKRRLKKEAWGG
jgi:hypothetical protein